MLRSTRILTSLAICAAPFLVAAGKPKPAPTPTPAPFVPEIAYSYTSGKTSDLRLANRDGSAAVLVHRTSGRLGRFDLSSEAAHKIAYTENGDVWIRTWTVSPFSVSNPQMLFDGPPVDSKGDGIVQVDFSPDDSKVVFGSQHQIFLYDFASRDVVTLGPRHWNLGQVRWSSDGQSILFISQEEGEAARAGGLWRIDPETQEMTRIRSMDENFDDYDFDVGRTTAGTLLLGAWVQFKSLFLYTADAQATGVKIPNAQDGHYNCSDTYVIHRVPVIASNGGLSFTTGITQIGGPTTAWSSDTKIGRTDWLRRSQCN